jgi:hypothetical protein
MSEIRLNVAAGAGRNRRVVGRIRPEPGMLTSAGVVDRVTKNTVFFTDGTARRKFTTVSVRHSEARKFGYPNARGCTRLRTQFVKVDGQYVAA